MGYEPFAGRNWKCHELECFQKLKKRDLPDIHKYNLILELLGGLITTKRRLVWLSRKDSMLVTGYDIRLFDL